MLRASGRELFYHTFLKPDGKNYYEIDFLISEGNQISPIEVKSSGYKSHVSLDKFVEKYSKRIRNKYIVYTKDLKQGKKYKLYSRLYGPFFIDRKWKCRTNMSRLAQERRKTWN